MSRYDPHVKEVPSVKSVVSSCLA